MPFETKTACCGSVPAGMKRHLRECAAKYETAAFFENDPSRFMRDLRGACARDGNREAVAFVASCLSFGSIPQFLPKIRHILDLAGDDVAGWIRSGAFRRAIRPDGDCFYRFVTKRHLHAFLEAYRRLMLRSGTLGKHVEACGDGTGPGAAKAICEAFKDSGAGYLVPCGTESACKRICMFLRWMGRAGSPVDIGLWSGFLDRKTLVMPLDTHVVQEAKSLGLLPQGATATMRTALRLTERMKEVFPDDPLKGDFALFGHHREICAKNKG